MDDKNPPIDYRAESRKDLDKKVADAIKRVPRFFSNPERVKVINEASESNPLIKEILQYHSTYPFNKIGLSCKESKEAKSFYVDVLKSIEFSKTLGDTVREILKNGEAFIVFEGSWGPPKILHPDSIVIAYIVNEYGSREEHIEHKPDREVRDMVLSTPKEEQEPLFKLLDAYSIRQLELGSYIDLSRSPYVKTLHPRRMTMMQPNAPRGVSYFDPVFDRLIESEKLKKELITGTVKDQQFAVKKIKETEKLIFEYAFPIDIRILDAEFKYLQEIVKHMLTENVFTPVAMTKNFTNDEGLILPTLQFHEIDIGNDHDYLSYREKLRNTLQINKTDISAKEYIKTITS